MNDDRLDEDLRALGSGTPFPVDWAAYERQLFVRLALAQVRRTRRSVGIGLLGALSGAAATLAFSLFLQPEPKDPPPYQVAAGRPKPSARNEGMPPRIGGVPPLQQEAQAGRATTPLVLRKIGHDGTMGEIRFLGAPQPDENRPGIIVSYDESR